MIKCYRPSISRLQQDFANRLDPNYRGPREITRAFDKKFEPLDPETTSVADDIAPSNQIEEAMVDYLPTCNEVEALE